MTTLTEARKALLQLVNSLPPQSTYATQAAIVADYLDNQVPLNIENKALRERLAAKTSSFGKARPIGALSKIEGTALTAILTDDLYPYPVAPHA